VAAEGGRVGCASSQLGVYRLQDPIEVSVDVVIPETKDTKAVAA